MRLFRSEKQKRALRAADQIYAELLAGKQIEVPNSLSKEDPVVLAMLALRKKYPKTIVTMLQSRTIVLSIGNAAKAGMSNQAWAHLEAHGYFPNSEVPDDTLLAAHSKFMAKNGRDPNEASRNAEDERKAKTLIEVATR